MVVAKIYVSGTCAQVIAKEPILAGLVGGRIEVIYEAGLWENLTRTVVFRSSATKDVITSERYVEIPPEVLVPGARLWVGFYGTVAGKALPTVWANLGTVVDGTDPSGDTSTDPALPVWAQLANEVDKLKQSGTGGGIAVTGARVGQTVTIAAVDEKGIPTAWQPEDFPDLTGYARSVNGVKPDPETGDVVINIPGSGGNAGFVVQPTEPEDTSVLWVDPDDDTEDNSQNAGIAVTGATVGQTVKIAAVDENGVPTAWEPTDFPSGGGSGVKWVKIADVTTEEDVTEIVVDDGIPDGITGLFFRIETKYAESVSYNYIAPTINGSGFIPTNLPLRDNRNIYNVTCEIHEDGTAHAFYGVINTETPTATIVYSSHINLPVTSVGIKHAGFPEGSLATGTVFKVWAKIGVKQ